MNAYSVDRLRALAVRSAREARDELGPSMWVAVPGAVFVALVLFAANDFTWDWLVLLGGVVAYPALFVAAFAMKFADNLRHPETHSEWIFTETRIMRVDANPPIFTFAIRSRIGAPHVEQHVCVVRLASGRRYEARSDRAGSGHTFVFEYPKDFGAEVPVSGDAYETVWFIDGREVLRRCEVISFE